MISKQNLIEICDCRIEKNNQIHFSQISWKMQQNENWVIIGNNKSGKTEFINSLANFNKCKILVNNENSYYKNEFENSVQIVSLENAAKIIQEERENDDSDFIEGGVDIGRTPRKFIFGNETKNSQQENNSIIQLCGIQKILDRGLKYLSTGEIRRTLLAKSLLSKSKMLIFSNPFAGLDIESRKKLSEFINSLCKEKIPKIIICVDRWNEIPSNFTNVLEFTKNSLSFCGKKEDYEIHLKNQQKSFNKDEFSVQVQKIIQETQNMNSQNSKNQKNEQNEFLVEMKNVNVCWGENLVIKNLNWILKSGEKWLIRGPNGSGKTTFLELITGDNMQVFCNDIKIFGKPRGSGETVWDIKKQLGIVSYRLHVEYTMVGGTSLLNVILSGFKDSIGLYEKPSDLEIQSAKKWLILGGFENRENESFGNLTYGEQRAILILRAAVKNPKILILDEPCHGLDEEFRAKVLHLIEILAVFENTTILHVTHDKTEVLEFEKKILEFPIK